MKSTVFLEDIASNLVFSSFNINNNDLENRSNNIFKTGSYILISINKPEFALKLANNGLNTTDMIDNTQGQTL